MVSTVEDVVISCKDVDGCAGNPCDTGQICHDLPPPSLGFSCACVAGSGAGCVGKAGLLPDVIQWPPKPPLVPWNIVTRGDQLLRLRI